MADAVQARADQGQERRGARVQAGEAGSRRTGRSLVPVGTVATTGARNGKTPDLSFVGGSYVFELVAEEGLEPPTRGL